MEERVKKQVLVVDDEVNLCEMLKINLENKGFDVQVAYSGEECLELLKEYKPDVVILDLILPRLTGHEVCAKIKIDRSPKTPVIIHSALTDDFNEKLSKLCKADAYVAKPQGLAHLEETIKQVMA